MLKKHNREKEYWFLGSGFLAFALVLFYIVIPWQITPQPGELISSDIFPRLATVVIAILGIGFLYDAYRMRKIGKTDSVRYSSVEEEENVEKMDWFSFCASIGVLLLYVLCLYLFGFIISTMFFLVLTMKKFGVGSIWKCLVIAAVVVVVLSLLFQSFMLIRLPKGLLTKMLIKLF